MLYKVEKDQEAQEKELVVGVAYRLEDGRRDQARFVR
jgi:hypothetical protein